MCLVSVRLVGDNSRPNAGRLEVYNDTEWGTVCGYFFDNRAAQVACSMLGFRSVVLRFDAILLYAVTLTFDL